MRKKIKKGQLWTSREKNLDMLILDVDKNRKWKVQIKTPSGKILKTSSSYTDKEIMENYDLKIEVHESEMHDQE
jgi:hypothetical protein